MTETEFTDETILCCECEKPFVYTAEQQEYHQSKGYEHKPKRCSNCRHLRKNTVPQHTRSSRSTGMSDRDLISEVGKAVAELRVFVGNEFRRLAQMIDEALPLDEEPDEKV